MKQACNHSTAIGSEYFAPSARHVPRLLPLLPHISCRTANTRAVEPRTTHFALRYMEVPRLLVDADLMVFSTAAIFVIRKFFHKCKRLENNIETLNTTLKTVHTDEKEGLSMLAVINEKFEQINDTLTAQQELQLEQGERQEDLQKSIYALIKRVKEQDEFTTEGIQKTLKAQEHLNDYFLVLDNDLSTKIDKIDNTLKTLFARWKHQLEPHIKTSDKAHRNHQEGFVEVKESFQELADNVCHELSVCNQ